ncbi:MAG: hypothetical protein KY437_09310 [Actinobacteria bacterium]|nr:hypothetical protein [Actinomycetota bacterium]
MATVCTSCGAENGPQDAYCWSCGVELGRMTTPDTHPDEAVTSESRTEREQQVDDGDGQEDDDGNGDDDAVAYSSETGQGD